MQGEIVEREGNLMNDDRKEVDLEGRGGRIRTVGSKSWGMVSRDYYMREITLLEILLQRKIN